LLDVNNVWVNSVNHGFDPRRYVEAIDATRVAEMHLAGHERRDAILVDTHACRVSDDVWDLYAFTVERIGARPTLVEWDADIPALDVLLEEAARAARVAAREATVSMRAPQATPA
jgi:hypothetical protein